MKHLKTYEENNDLPIDLSDKFKYKKDPKKFSWNQKKPDEGVTLGKSGKWLVRVKKVDTGQYATISQHIYKDDAQKAYDDYYKNNKKQKQNFAKDDDTFKTFYSKDKEYDSVTGFRKQNRYVKNYYNPNQANEDDFVIVNFDITDYKPSETDKLFIDFVNNSIGKIITKNSNELLTIRYQRIPDNIKDYFSYDTKIFNMKDIKHYSKVKKDLRKYIKTKPKPKPEINLDGEIWNFYGKKLKELPEIKEGVKTLNCSDNNLTKIPKLPSTLRKFSCNKNEDLIELPELPEGLLELDCRNLNIKELPKLPSTLKILNCGGCNFISELPELPDSLVNLHAVECNLSTLPELPEGLTSLVCRDNKLIYLPELPESSRLRIRIDGNRLPYDNMVEYKKYIKKHKQIIDRLGYNYAMETLYNRKH